MSLGQSSSIPKFSATGNWCDSWLLHSSFPFAFQVYVWTHANEAKPPPRSPLEYGWRNENKYLMPKYFEWPMTFDFLQDLVCMCKGKFICSKNCVCVEQNLSCTSICGFQGNDDCFFLLFFFLFFPSQVSALDVTWTILVNSQIFSYRQLVWQLIATFVISLKTADARTR
jgi:hypothetical protein